MRTRTRDGRDVNLISSESAAHAAEPVWRSWQGHKRPLVQLPFEFSDMPGSGLQVSNGPCVTCSLKLLTARGAKAQLKHRQSKCAFSLAAASVSPPASCEEFCKITMLHSATRLRL